MALVHVERPSDGAPEGLLVLHHGRGSDEQDLLGLADVLDPARRLHVVSPRAPLTLPGWPGYHWYVVPRVGYPDPDTFRASYGELSALHDELWERTGVGPGAHGARGLLDGVGHELRARPRARTAPPRRASWRSAASFPPSRAGSRTSQAAAAPRVFIAHGRRDPVMSVEFARQATELLEGGRTGGGVPRVGRRAPHRSGASAARARVARQGAAGAVTLRRCGRRESNPHALSSTGT